MIVDYEKVVLDLKARLREGAKSDRPKRSWGHDELLGLLADLELEHRLPESQQMFDDRPVLRPVDSSDPPSLDEPVAAVASGAS